MNIAFDATKGDRGVCKVDGIVRPNVVFGITGWNGFVYQFVRNKNGTPVVKNGEIVKRKVRGNVQVRFTRRSQSHER